MAVKIVALFDYASLKQSKHLLNQVIDPLTIQALKKNIYKLIKNGQSS